MTLTYQQIQQFVATNGNVTAWCKAGTVTMLRDGQVNTVRFWENDSSRFEVEGKVYDREEFEALVKARENTKA
jgi:hypothetical protein